MRNDLELDAIIEDYLMDKLSDAEKIAFEQLRSSDAAVDHKVVTHKAFLQTMGLFAEQTSLKNRLNQIHEQIDVETLAEELKPHASWGVKLWRRHKFSVAVAASLILLTFVSLYSIQYSNKQEGSYEVVRRELASIKKSQNSLIRNINAKQDKKSNSNPGKFGGTGFAISANGYILTNLHVINDADSVYIQNNKGESFKVKTVYSDSQYDIAILKVIDDNFTPLDQVPYSIKRTGTEMGEKVYTIGFPKDDAVFGEGYVSSKTGFNSDSIAYQVSIRVDPGNSGGPLLDSDGNLVGVISGKESRTDGAAFAIKSKYILEAMRAIPQDSLGKKTALNKKSQLLGLKRTEQLEKLQDYVFMVKVYN